MCVWWIWNENTNIYRRHSRNSHQITHTFEIVSVTNCITMTWAQICCKRLLWLILLLTVSWWVALICAPLLIIVGLLQMCFPTLTPAWVMLVGGACFPAICSRQIFSRYFFNYVFVSQNTCYIINNWKVPSVYRSRDEEPLAIKHSEDEGNLVDTSPLLLRSPSSLTLLSHNPGDTRWHPATRKVVKVVKVDNIKGTVDVELEKGDRVTVARNTIVP